MELSPQKRCTFLLLDKGKDFGGKCKNSSFQIFSCYSIVIPIDSLKSK